MTESNTNSSVDESLKEDFSYIQQKLQSEPTNDRLKVILFATGSYCPVHKGHLHVFDVAAKYLIENHNIDVLAGYISPSCDDYVFSKLGEDAIPFTHRYEMVRRACIEHNNQENSIPVFLSSWEGLSPSFVDFPSVRKRFQKTINKIFPDKNIQVFYIAGADLFVRCCLKYWKKCIAIERPGSYTLSSFHSDLSKHIYICNDPNYSDYYTDASSTQMRTLHQNGESLQNITYQSVIDYLRDVLHW